MLFRDQAEVRNNEMNANFDLVGNNNVIDNDMNIDVNMMTPTTGMNMGMGGCPNRPIFEPVQERCVHKTIVHEVPHVCPIRTRVINHHIYKHTYRPEYSCCEENVCSQMNCGSCCQFR